MEKKNIVTCPFCRSKENWYVQNTGDVKAYQCVECSRYFKVQVSEPERRVKQTAAK